MPVAGGLALAIRLRFHNHAPQQRSLGLAFHQQAADELGGDLLGGTTKEGLGERVWECWEGLGGYGSGFGGEWLRAYCGTRHHQRIAAIELLIDYPRILPSYNQRRRLDYRLNQTLHCRGWCKLKQASD